MNFKKYNFLLIIIIKELFVNNIEQLIHSLPLNHKTEAGNLFWSGSKRPPQLVPYNSEDPLCLNFVKELTYRFYDV